MATKTKQATDDKEVAQKTAAKVASTVLKEEVSKTEKPKVSTKSKKAPSLEDIRQKAYEIFLRTGNHNEHENWVQAETELLK